MPPVAIYAAHALFWSPAALRIIAGKRGDTAGPSTDRVHSARGARAALWAHCVGFFLLYFGIGRAAFGGGSSFLPGAGLAIIALGTALFALTLWVFRSWRLLTKLDEGHQLYTAGPFRLVRHPIYTALDLLALGSALWIPLPEVIAGAALIALVSDVRARLEEGLLLEAFGAEYAAYKARTRRFLPWVY